VGIRKTFQSVRPGFGLGSGVVVEASKHIGGIETGGLLSSRDEPGGCPCCWPGGVRRRGGVSLICGSCAEREKASVDAATGVVGP
jgi:hypothetical protein